MLLKNKFFLILTLAASVVVFSTGVFAQDDKTAPPATKQKAEKPFKGEGRGFGNRKFGRQDFGDRRGMRGGPMAMIHGLNLTDAQKDQIKKIVQSNKPDQATIDRIKTFREARKSGTPPTDEQKAQMKAFREQAHAKAKSIHEQILSVLTADQKTQLEQRREQMKQKREQFRKNRPSRPAPKTTDKPKIT